MTQQVKVGVGGGRVGAEQGQTEEGTLIRSASQVFICCGQTEDGDDSDADNENGNENDNDDVDEDEVAVAGGCSCCQENG